MQSNFKKRKTLSKQNKSKTFLKGLNFEGAKF